MPTKTVTTIDLTNKFYCNVDIDSEVAMKLLSLAIKKAMAEHSLHNLSVKLDPGEYKETVEAIKYVFGVAKEQGVLNDKFLYAAASDSYNDVLLTGKFQTEVAHAICEEFSITPQSPNIVTKWFVRTTPVRFHLPQGPENQRLSIEKILKVVEVTTGMKIERKVKMSRNTGEFKASFMDEADSFSIGAPFPGGFSAQFQK